MRILLSTALWFCAGNLLTAVLPAQCSNATQIPNQTISSGTYNFPDNNALSASNVVVNGSASVTFVAGNCIQLLPGFNATAGTAGTTFHAWVETAPANVLFSPSGASGLQQAFTWTVSSPSGYANISDIFGLFNTSLSVVSGCFIHYNAGSNLLYLADNSSANWSSGIVPGGSGSARNSQCIISGNGSSVSPAGTQLAVTVSVTFQPSFAGAQNEYLIGYDNQGLYAPWEPMGMWTVAQTSLTALATSVTTVPNTAQGSAGVFTFKFSDAGGAPSLTTVSAMIASTAPSGANTALPVSCVVTYNVAENTLALLTDAGSRPSTVIIPGSGSQSNSQCILNGAGSSVSQSGNVLTLNLAIGFTGAYAGNKTIYGWAQDNNGSPGWQTLGAWNAAAIPVVYSMIPPTPSLSPGAQQAISFEFFDAVGWRDIAAFEISFGPVGNAPTGNPGYAWPGACVLNYTPTGNNYNTLYLADQSGNFSQSFIVQNPINPPPVLSNSQCAVYDSGTTVSYPFGPGGADFLKLTPLISFTSAYAAAYPGMQAVYVQAVNLANQSSGWLPVGTVCVGGSCGSGGGSGTLGNVVTSSPTGLQLILDGGSTNGGVTCTSPCYAQWYPGSTHTIAPAAASQTLSGAQYTFSNWSLGGATNTGSAFAATILAPSGAGGTYTANFAAQYYLTTSVNPAGAGTVTGSSLYPAGPVQITATPNVGYDFDSFSGALTGTNSSAGLTLTGAASVTANFRPGPLTSFQSFLDCLADRRMMPSCSLPAGNYLVSATIMIGRSNVLISGGTGVPSRTVLVRATDFPGDMMDVNGPSPLTGIVIRDLTFCGGNSLDTSPTAICQAAYTATGASGLTTCQGMINTGPCIDLGIYNADTQANNSQPFGPTRLTPPVTLDIIASRFRT